MVAPSSQRNKVHLPSSRQHFLYPMRRGGVVGCRWPQDACVHVDPNRHGRWAGGGGLALCSIVAQLGKLLRNESIKQTERRRAVPLCSFRDSRVSITRVEGWELFTGLSDSNDIRRWY